MRTCTASSLLTARRAAAAAVGRHQVRDISIGTDLTKSSLCWQKARPWHMDAESSNKAVDNAVSMKEIFSGKTVVVFGVPAPFTGTCTYEHFPPYKQRAKLFKEDGVDSIICYTVADPYAHYNWGLAMGKEDVDDITFLADPDCEWAKEYDLDADYSGASLGIRSKRFSMLVEDGVVKTFHDLTGKDAGEDAETMLCDVRKFGK
jgi:peroxiredoxin